jgi:hypothetical protein
MNGLSTCSYFLTPPPPFSQKFLFYSMVLLNRISGSRGSPQPPTLYPVPRFEFKQQRPSFDISSWILLRFVT